MCHGGDEISVYDDLGLPRPYLTIAHVKFFSLCLNFSSHQWQYLFNDCSSSIWVLSKTERVIGAGGILLWRIPDQEPNCHPAPELRCGGGRLLEAAAIPRADDPEEEVGL